MLDKYSCTWRDGRGDRCKATRRASQCGKNTEHRWVLTLLLNKELLCRNSIRGASVIEKDRGLSYHCRNIGHWVLCALKREKIFCPLWIMVSYP